MTCQKFYWQKGISRYYKAYIFKDLLNHWTVLCWWGGVGSRLGNKKNHVFASLDEANKFAEKIKKRRIKRGYLLMCK